MQYANMNNDGWKECLILMFIWRFTQKHKKVCYAEYLLYKAILRDFLITMSLRAEVCVYILTKCSTDC